MKSLKLRFLLSFVGLMTIVNLFSQDKHDYATPLGKSIFYREVRDANRVLLRMSEVGPISKGMDGIVLVFNMRQDLSRITRPLKLISFNSTSEEANSHLEIYYHEGTITIRRKTYPNSEFYYDYNLYDPMFTVDEGVVQWEVHLYLSLIHI